MGFLRKCNDYRTAFSGRTDPMAAKYGTGLIGLLLVAAILSTVIARRNGAHPPESVGGCGPTSLYALMRSLKVQVNQSEVFRLCGGDRFESSFADLEKAAIQLGFDAHGEIMDTADIRRLKPMGILHLNGDHFVAIIGYNQHGPLIADPVSKGQTWDTFWTYDNLSERWDGRILVVKRTAPK